MRRCLSCRFAARIPVPCRMRRLMGVGITMIERFYAFRAQALTNSRTCSIFPHPGPMARSNRSTDARGVLMGSDKVFAISVGFLACLLLCADADAQPRCVDIGTDASYGLAGNPSVLKLSSRVVPIT